MVEPLIIVAAVIVLALVAFAIIKKLFKLAFIVGAVALGVWLGLTLFQNAG